MVCEKLFFFFDDWPWYKLNLWTKRMPECIRWCALLLQSGFTKLSWSASEGHRSVKMCLIAPCWLFSIALIGSRVDLIIQWRRQGNFSLALHWHSYFCSALRSQGRGGYSGPSIVATISPLTTLSRGSLKTGQGLPDHLHLCFITLCADHFHSFYLVLFFLISSLLMSTFVFPGCSLKPGTKRRRPKRSRWLRRWRGKSSRTRVKLQPRLLTSETPDLVLCLTYSSWYTQL